MGSIEETNVLTSKFDGPYGQVVLFGDSITENSFNTELGFSYAAALSHALKRRLDVINRGFSGYNTQHALAVLPKFMPTPSQAKLELLVVCFGANDSCLPNDPTGHHVPVEVYRNNLVAIVNHPKVQAHKPRILLVTPPPVDEYQQSAVDEARGFDQLRRTAENTERYVKACRDVGSQLKVPVVDIWTSFLVHAGWIEEGWLPGSRNTTANKTLQSLLSDGLHLTPLGYKLVFEEVMKSIKEHFPALNPERMSYCYPPWEVAPKQITTIHPE